MTAAHSRPAWILLLAAILLGASGAQAADAFFQVRKSDGKWWLIDPDGRPFLSKGVTTVQFAQDTIQGTHRSPYGETNQAKYGSREAWRQAAAKRLIDWGFNTLGAWSDEELAKIEVEGKRLAYAPTIDLGAAFVAQKTQGKQAWLHGVFPDVFDPEFAKTAQRIANQRCAPRKDDRQLLGWFTDNELRWGPDWRGKEELLTLFLALPANAPGRQAAIDLLRQRHGDIAKFNAVWKAGFKSWDELAAAGAIKPPVVRPAVYAQNQAQEREANQSDPHRAAFVADCEAFLTSLAERYFRITCEAVRSADPHHIVFGCRFAYVPPAPVVAAAAKHLDAISFNCYDTDPRRAIDAYSVFGKPLVIGEFAFRGDDSGLPNTRGAGPRVKTQADRAAAFTRYATWALSKPNLVGYHWFEHADEPKEGRFDGENSNYGLVNLRDEPYQALTEAMSRLNAQAELLHGKP
jgi:agarase